MWVICFCYFYNNVASRILFKDKERKWEEIENKLQAEHDSLLLKSSNKVINPLLLFQLVKPKVIILAAIVACLKKCGRVAGSRYLLCRLARRWIVWICCTYMTDVHHRLGFFLKLLSHIVC